ncbi:ATP-binding protein [Pseudothermotoga elfii]|uniref:ATP-binding protein n=1 Tax=Pseudothermotoga elfii TaxID=38322 RepID=UPI000427C40F|nr:ATP-binding protein [Pseudothermotoga elfii]
MGLRTIADHIMDITQNSFKAEAKKITLTIEENKNWFCFQVEDDGCGMDDEQLKTAFDPFYTTRDHRIRKFGLGLPFLKQAAEATGGAVEIRSAKGAGTFVKACFDTNHVDCQSIGDLAGCLSTLILSATDVELQVNRFKDGKTYFISSGELKKYLPDFSSVKAIKIVYEIIEELEESIK